MDFDTIGDIYSLITSVAGLLICLFNYVERPRRGWLYATAFFLANLLSNYYWTLYTLIMGEDPNTSAMLAYFGWNVSYVLLVVLIRHVQTEGEKKYIHPLMFIPIPLNIAQFILYIPYGGILNNTWSGLFCTAIAVFSLQGILYYYRKDKSAGSPMIYITTLLIVLFEYGMWTSSCFSWPNPALDPYYYCEVLEYSLFLFMPLALIKKMQAREHENVQDNAFSTNAQYILRIVFVLIIAVCFAAGYGIAMWMKHKLTIGVPVEFMGDAYNAIAIMLFIISLLLLILVLAIMYMVAKRQRTQISDAISSITEIIGDKTEDARTLITESHSKARKGRNNIIITLAITFVLMSIVVYYTSRLFYNTYVDDAYELAENKVGAVASMLDNYLEISKSVLWVTADTVEVMLEREVDTESIHQYLLDETVKQQQQLDNAYNGLYGYIDGEYVDGLNWEPPADFVPTERTWYKEAINGGGEVTIVSPYIDMYTGEMVVSFSKLLEDGESVMSFDVIIDQIHDAVNDLKMNETGYGMIIDQNGYVITHSDPGQNGAHIDDLNPGTGFGKMITDNETGNFQITLNGEKYLVFVGSTACGWRTVSVVNRTELFADMQKQIILNIAVYLGVFLLTAFFYYSGLKNQEENILKVEALNISRQKQEYEAKLLKIEKSAADEANKAKSSFLADMSHEIRTPINSVLGMNEMILRESHDDNILSYANNIQTSGKALLLLINSILDFSKIEDGKMEIVPADYRTVDMISYLINSISERAKNNSLDLIVDVDPTLPSVLRGDDVRISQVIVNLLTNAVKYTDSGSVTLRVLEEARRGDRIDLYVEVKDTGIGIKEEDMGKLFESFKRLDEGRNRTIEGTGLGMSIVTNLLALMNSELKVESEYGKGSKFFFVIRQTIVNETPIGNHFNKDEESKEAGKKSGTYKELFTAPDAKVLVVDDTKLNLMVAVNLLKKTGIQITTALSGEEALGFTDKTAFDVILMDQRMPKMDGIETMKHIKEQPGSLNKNTPVICLTADAISGAKDRYLAEGFNDYLTKPIEGDSLEKMLLRYLPEEKVIKS